jgi:glycosyltransferase involved in cell wall biosynthesis
MSAKNFQDRSKMTFSIITASYNDLHGLIETSKSILNQTLPVEWIIIDADSGPEVRKFLKSIKSKNHTVIWKSEKDSGLYDGMNKGFELSTGEIILFLNCGDTLADSMILEKLNADYKVYEWTWAVGLAVRFDSNNNPRAVWEYLMPEMGGLALGTRTFCHQATFYTRELFEGIKPYQIDNLAADHLLNVKAFKKSTPQMLPYVTTHFMDGGISSLRPFSAAMRDLRQIRIQEDLLLLNSRIIDLLLSKIVVILISVGSFVWKSMRLISRKLARQELRQEFPGQVNAKKLNPNA